MIKMPLAPIVAGPIAVHWEEVVYDDIVGWACQVTCRLCEIAINGVIPDRDLARDADAAVNQLYAQLLDHVESCSQPHHCGHMYWWIWAHIHRN